MLVCPALLLSYSRMTCCTRITCFTCSDTGVTPYSLLPLYCMCVNVCDSCICVSGELYLRVWVSWCHLRV
jgi:hypothetical protein